MNNYQASAARFSPNAVIIKPYCRLKIELNFLDIHNISFKNTGFFGAFLFYGSFAALRVIYSRFPSHYLLYFCAFLNGPGIALRTKMKRVLVFRVLVFRVLGFRVLVFRVLGLRS